MESKTVAKPGPTSPVPDVRRTPLEQLAENSDLSVLRVVTSVPTVKPQTSAFDASL